MGKRKRYAVILGTRPEFIKFSGFLHQAPHLGIDLFTIHTGQHYDENMSGIFFTELGLSAPDVLLSVSAGRDSGSIGKMISLVEETIVHEAASLNGVIVLGDTFTTLAGGVAAAHSGLPIIHIEAGLRSNDRRMPEEMNRIIIDHLSNNLCTTEASANENLLLEGIPEERIHFVGNIGIESFERMRKTISERRTYSHFGLVPKQYRVATIHRQEHTHNPTILRQMCAVLSHLNEHMPLIMPLHPATRRKLEEFELMRLLTVTVIEPLGYLDFMSLIVNSAGIVTDSGGIQEEAAHLGIPCSTVRETTERPVTVRYGSNKLFPPTHFSDTTIVDMEEHLARSFTPGAIPLWDSGVSKRIVEQIL